MFFKNMDDGTKGLVRALYLNIIGVILSFFDPMVFFAMVLLGVNIAMAMVLSYYIFGETIEDVLNFFKRKNN